ncbi:C10 family peptidase [Wenyingzhuangia sp. 1_MG-2023]|nr:C10 family peptidase [Wenyingzhuangia sp. 1_MG-2023]
MKKQNTKLKLTKYTVLVILTFYNTITFSQTKEPFLTDVWGGVNCFDDNNRAVYPGNYYTPSHSSAGCVAISMSQVLYYYKWPIIGAGSNVYSDYYNGTLTRHASFFDNIEYDWANMLDEYQGVASTETEQKAVGELFYSVACGLEMNFEPSGSTSNVNKTPFVYQNFFRYACHYEDVSWSSFWSRLKENVLAGYPVPIAISATRTGDGHVVVANGYKEINGKPYYYLNWGWYNENGINGWYNIQGWTSASAGYNTVDGATFDIMPNPQITSIEKTGATNDFTIKWEVSERINWNEFTLEQKVDGGDWTEVATGITDKEYTISNPVGNVYQFRVKSMIDDVYYVDSWSEPEVYAVQGSIDGYGVFGGSQYAYAYQTPDSDLNFTNDYTFETWIRLKSNSSSGDVIIDQQPVFGLEVANVGTSDYAVKFISHSTNAELSSSTTGAKLAMNEWVHVAVSHSGNTTKLFVNGVLREENTSTNFNLNSSNSALNIGERYSGGYSGLIEADLDQIRISSSARYSSNFTPLKEQIYEVDESTILYLPFQNVHSVRLKDAASNLSFRVQNATNYVEWSFDETSGSLNNETFELIKSSLSVFPNPVTDNKLQISFNEQLDLRNIEFKAFDSQGRSIQINSFKTEFNQWNITFNHAIPGIYFLKIIGDGFTATKKIMIQ